MCEVVVLPIKPIVFLTFSFSSASLDLKVPNVNFRLGHTWGKKYLNLPIRHL